MLVNSISIGSDSTHADSAFAGTDIEGLNQALKQVLTLNKSFTFWGGGQCLFSLLGEQAYHWFQETERLKIKGQVLLSERDLIPLPSTVSVRFVSANYISRNCIITCGDTSIIISLIDSIEIKTIEHNFFTQTLRNQFLYIWDNASQSLPHLDFLKREDFSRLPKEHYASTWDVEPELLNRLKTNQQAAFVVNLQSVRDSYLCFVHHFPDVEVYYSVKTNPDIRVLTTLQQIGSKFEVVAYDEIEYVFKAGAKVSDIIYSGPVKREKDIIQAYAAGVRIFCVDSYVEIDKLAKHAPESKLLLRLKTKDNGSRIRLSSKYGVAIEEALTYLDYIKAAQLEPYGLTFHVGGQNEDFSSWESALKDVHKLIESANMQGFQLQVANIGGGFPIPLHKDIPSLAQIGETIKHRVPHLRYFAEPGRIIVSEACKLVFPIISRTNKEDKIWLYVDGSIFGSLFMIGGHQFNYPITADHVHLDYEEYVIASISCDGRDIIACNALLPEGLSVGNLLTFHLVGAYSLPIFNVAYAGVSKIQTYYQD